jgi:hypothetical protein
MGLSEIATEGGSRRGRFLGDHFCVGGLADPSGGVVTVVLTDDFRDE